MSFDFKFGLQFLHFLVCNVKMGITVLIYYLLLSSWGFVLFYFVFHNGLNATVMLDTEREFVTS